MFSQNEVQLFKEKRLIIMHYYLNLLILLAGLLAIAGLIINRQKVHKELRKFNLKSLPNQTQSYQTQPGSISDLVKG